MGHGGRCREAACGAAAAQAVEQDVEHPPRAHGGFRRDRRRQHHAAHRAVQELAAPDPRPSRLDRRRDDHLLPGQPPHSRGDESPGPSHRAQGPARGHRGGVRGRGGERRLGPRDFFPHGAGRPLLHLGPAAERRGHRGSAQVRGPVASRVPHRRSRAALHARLHLALLHPRDAPQRRRPRSRGGRGGGHHRRAGRGRAHEHVRHGLRLVHVLGRALGLDHQPALQDPRHVHRRPRHPRPHPLLRLLLHRLRLGQDRRRPPRNRRGEQVGRQDDHLHRLRRFRLGRLRLGAQLRRRRHGRR
mmetsp:Transcript_17712/g.50442  ORF Transcript_17712/g.50442 Transcript_17712/m.50442 type:complete len:301 (+) Transcript_17712:450-1352(+)